MVDRITSFPTENTVTINLLTTLIEDWDPYWIWLTTVTLNADPGNNYYYKCFKCYGYLHQNVPDED